MRTRYVLRMVPLLLLVVGIMACSVLTGLQEAVFGSPTPGPTLIQLADIQATQTSLAEQINAATVAFETQQTLQAQQAAETKIAADLFATATQLSAAQPTATPIIVATSTPQTGALDPVIQKLFDDGKVGSKKGSAFALSDFEDSQALLNNYFWSKTGYTADDFVIAADVDWSTASKTSNWPWTGCGFVAGLQKPEEHLFAFLGLDGFVRIARQTANGPKYFTDRRYGKLDIPEGSAHLMLVAYNQKIAFYVNDQLVNEANDTRYKEGPIYYAVFSGTNKDYGTRCTFKNINLFIFE